MGWRSRGLAQGSALSPLLSVLPLLVLEELEEKYGIKAIYYADDGILYCDADEDILELLQTILDENGTGVRVHDLKSGWVKREGV